MQTRDFTLLAAQFESYLLTHQPHGEPDSLYAPVRYINTLGGKRIRPVLLLMAYQLWQEDITPALPAAMAIEYFHNFSLMHDDIMDEAPLRRGDQTVHEAFGRNSAILSGDAMLIRCFELLLQAGHPTQSGAPLCDIMCKAALEICEGQQMDMDFEKLESPTEAQYLEMIRKKTACLLGVSLQIGALLAGAQADEARALYAFGEQMGLGFQIQDDYLDVFGDTALTGKQRGGDILRGKKNFLFVHTYNHLHANDRKNFSATYTEASHLQLIEPVLHWYESRGAGPYTQEVQVSYFGKGLNILESVKGPDLSALLSLSRHLMSRVR